MAQRPAQRRSQELLEPAGLSRHRAAAARTGDLAPQQDRHLLTSRQDPQPTPGTLPPSIPRALRYRRASPPRQPRPGTVTLGDDGRPARSGTLSATPGIAAADGSANGTPRKQAIRARADAAPATKAQAAASAKRISALLIRRFRVRPPDAPHALSWEYMAEDHPLTTGVETNVALAQSGHIERLPSGSLRVSVLAGRDPLNGRQLWLRKTIRTGISQGVPGCGRRSPLIAQLGSSC